VKILIIEDSNTLCYIMVKLLKELGYKDIAAVESAEAAMRFFRVRRVTMFCSSTGNFRKCRGWNC
jgi:CheY-like chemotaxis protein